LTTSAEPPPAAGWRRWLAPVVGLIVSGGLLYWALQGVDIRAAWVAARDADLGWLLLSVAVATLTFVIRVPRWQQLLRTDDESPLPTLAAWHGVAIGFMANNLIPRSGEVLRAFVASRLVRVGFTRAISSVAVERIFDGLTITILLALALLSPAIPADARVNDILVRDLAVRGGILCLVLLGGAMLVVLLPARAERLVHRLVPWPGVAKRLAGVIRGVAEGLGAMRSPARLAAVAAWSAVLWLVGAASFWLMFRAFGLDLGWSAAFLVQGVLAFGVALPSTPGYVGVFEAVIVAVLSVFGIDRDLAFAYAVSYHVATFLPITLLGVGSVFSTPISVRDLFSKRR
jgi:uncharacterized protein (TIRG00374 family)